MERKYLVQNQSKKSSLGKILSLILMLSIIVFLVVTIVNSLNVTYKKMKILEVAKQDVEELRIKNLELLLEKEKVQSDEYLEAEARNKLKYAKDGEVAFVIPIEILESEIISDQLEKAKGIKKEEEIHSSKDLVDIWSNFLFSAGL